MKDNYEELQQMLDTPLGSLSEELADNGITLDREFIISLAKVACSLLVIGLAIVVPVVIYALVLGY